MDKLRWCTGKKEGLSLVEPELRPEYAEKLSALEKQKSVPFKNIAELRKITKTR